MQTFLMVASQDPASKSEAEDHAREQAPLEACGLLYESATVQHYQRCRNVCNEPDRHFVLDPVDYYRTSLKGKIIAVIHSHPNGEEPSEADRRACSQTKLPWHIYQLPQDQWLTINP